MQVDALSHVRAVLSAAKAAERAFDTAWQEALVLLPAGDGEDLHDALVALASTKVSWQRAYATAASALGNGDLWLAWQVSS